MQAKEKLDELIFSMIPASKQKGLDYSILNEKIGPKTHKGLSSAIIYGPNASGKTNIIGAMEGFLEADYNRKLLSEVLSINEKMIFSRNSSLEFGDLKVIKGYLINEFEDNEIGATTLAKNNVNNEELFLMNGFKAMFILKRNYKGLRFKKATLLALQIMSHNIFNVA